MRLNRRLFLEQAGACGLLSLGVAPPALLSRMARAGENSANDRILVVVELAGGNDGLNTVIPYGDDVYHRSRPGIAIPQTNLLRIDDYLGLHPSLRELKDRYDNGSVAIVQGVGYPNPDRSHFRSMDIWHSAQPENESPQIGWLGAALDHDAQRRSGEMPALAIGSQERPLAVTAYDVNVPNVQSLEEYRLQPGAADAERAAARQRVLGQLADQQAPQGSDLEFLRRTTRTALQSARKIEEVLARGAGNIKYPATGLGQKLHAVSRVIASDLGTRIFFVSLGGFDTHSQQQGAHQGLLAELSGAVNAFFQDLEQQHLDERVLLVTFSEFGRRVHENGSLGTDHGAASQMFVMGPDTNGGLVGEHPSLNDLTQGDLKHHTDFRSVYATLLENWLQIPAEPVLGKQFPKLNFVST